MVVFQDLRITPDGEELCIDSIIAPYDFYEGEYIASIAIDFEGTYTPSGSSQKPIYYKEFTEHNKQQSLILKASELNNNPDYTFSDFRNHIFYVYVTVGGAPSPDTDCGWDNATTLGVAIDWYSIYYMGINHMKKVKDNCCDIPREFIDYILRFKAFELALRTANYQLANERFLQWFSSMSKPVYVPPCNCS